MEMVYTMIYTVVLVLVAILLVILKNNLLRLSAIGAVAVVVSQLMAGNVCISIAGVLDYADTKDFDLRLMSLMAMSSNQSRLLFTIGLVLVVIGILMYFFMKWLNPNPNPDIKKE